MDRRSNGVVGSVSSITSSSSWAPWQTLETRLQFSPESLAETLDGGQAFRWNRIEDGAWEGVWGENIVRLKTDAANRLLWQYPVNQVSGTESELIHYLGGDADYDTMVDSLPWRSDTVLARAMEHWSGLRILRQPLGETLFTFLCSSTKQILQIKQICEAVACEFGPPLATGCHALPSWEALNEIPEEALRACKAGYRARYIKGTAQFLAKHPGYLDDLPALPYTEGKAKLLHLPGVGEKIADCVLLFGAGKLEAFPVDVWVLKAMARLYGLVGWKPEQVAQFGRAHFGPYAGLAQQFLFASERRGK